MRHKNSGITLIETLIAVMILSVLALSLYTVFKSGIDAWTKAESRLEIYQNARAVLDQLSRELVGAFVTSGATGAKFDGTYGGSNDDPDTLVFITDFADSIYKIRYELDDADPDNKILKRDYIDYGVTHTPAKDYTNTDYDESIELVPPTKGTMVDNIKFTYLAQIDVAPFLDWSSERTEWLGSGATAPAADSLPEAVKIVLTLRDANGNQYPFETIVYLPNSETE
ncbi:MAG: type II secretion system protein [Candidatus Omnitrophota bacterium]